MSSILSSVHGGEVELLHWFGSGFDDQAAKKKTEFRSLKDTGWVSDTNVEFCDLKTKSIHVADRT